MEFIVYISPLQSSHHSFSYLFCANLRLNIKPAIKINPAPITKTTGNQKRYFVKKELELHLIISAVRMVFSKSLDFSRNSPVGETIREYPVLAAR